MFSFWHWTKKRVSRPPSFQEASRLVRRLHYDWAAEQVYFQGLLERPVWTSGPLPVASEIPGPYGPAVQAYSEPTRAHAGLDCQRRSFQDLARSIVTLHLKGLELDAGLDHMFIGAPQLRFLAEGKVPEYKGNIGGVGTAQEWVAGQPDAASLYLLDVQAVASAHPRVTQVCVKAVGAEQGYMLSTKYTLRHWLLLKLFVWHRGGSPSPTLRRDFGACRHCDELVLLRTGESDENIFPLRPGLLVYPELRPQLYGAKVPSDL